MALLNLPRSSSACRGSPLVKSRARVAKSACESRLSLQARAWFSWHLGWVCRVLCFLLRRLAFCALLGRGSLPLLPQDRLTRLILRGALLDQRDKGGKPG